MTDYRMLMDKDDPRENARRPYGSKASQKPMVRDEAYSQFPISQLGESHGG